MASPSNHRASRRVKVILAAVLGWIVVIVVAAGRDGADPLLGVDNLNVIWITLLVGGALLGLALLLILKPFSGEFETPERGGGGVGILLLVALAVVIWRPSLLDGLIAEELETAPEEVGVVVPESKDSEAVVETVAQASDILLLLAGAAALGGLWLFVRHRESLAIADLTVQEANAELEAELLAAMDDASLVITEETDPKLAVLRVYAMLEAVLESHGKARHKAETPTEHLRRSVEHLRVDAAPLAKLSGLYELARFSGQTITVAQQHEAAEALDRARTQLAAHL